MNVPAGLPRTLMLAAIAIVLPACSTTPAKPSAATTTASPPRSTLPGEGIGDATNRVLADCYAKYGIVSVKSGDGGLLSDLNTGTSPGLTVQDILADCNGAVNDAGLTSFTPLTNDQLSARYRQVVTWHDCIVAQGFQIGPPVSEEAFIAAKGALTWFPGYNKAIYGIGVKALDALDAACPQPK
jgi:hypothetical protein